MTDYKPGTVAKATVRGVPDVTVFLADPGSGVEWTSAGYVGGDHLWHADGDVTDVRPLVVLDPSDPTVEHFVSQWRGASGVGWHGAAGDLCRLIEEQTRPAIEEPKGLGAIVKAITSPDGGKTVIYPEPTHLVYDGVSWRCERGAYEWLDLINPEVIREGVQP